MAWPTFDLAQPINLAIGGVVTLGSVYIGALLASRHFRAQRQFDRALEWTERLVRVFNVYQQRMWAAIDEIIAGAKGQTESGEANEAFNRSGRALGQTLRMGRVYFEKEMILERERAVEDLQSDGADLIIDLLRLLQERTPDGVKWRDFNEVRFTQPYTNLMDQIESHQMKLHSESRKLREMVREHLRSSR